MALKRKSPVKPLLLMIVMFQVVNSQRLFPTVSSSTSKKVNLPKITSLDLDEALESAERIIEGRSRAESVTLTKESISKKSELAISISSRYHNLKTSNDQSSFENFTFKVLESKRTKYLYPQSDAAVRLNEISAESRHQASFLANSETMRNQGRQEVLEAAAEILQKKFRLTPAQTAHGLPRVNLAGSPRGAQAAQFCQDANRHNCIDSVYRTADGSCNNEVDPSLGRSNTCFGRLLPANYDNGISVPRKSVKGGPLPNVRKVSVILLNDVNVPNTVATHMTMQFSQFVGHDLLLTPISRRAKSEPIECCNVQGELDKECLPIRISPNDPFYGPFNKTCLNFVRSAICSNCILGPRQIPNQHTAYIDGSQIYGSTQNDTNSLRSFSNGELRAQISKKAGELLPQSGDIANDQCSRPKEKPDGICFQAGDGRINLHPALATLHTLWLRQHNRIARSFKNLTPSANDEEIFQKTRRVVVAQLQMIIYNELLPLLIGKRYVRHFGINRKSKGYTSYDSQTRPAIVLEFSSSAYRFGHSLVQDKFLKTGETSSSFNLKDNFFFPFGLYTGDFEPILRGLSKQPAQEFDRHLVKSLTEHVYQVRGDKFGFDLGALNIQRGRDLGIQRYITYLDYCFSLKIVTFKDLERVMTPTNAIRASKVYVDPKDIDLYVGGLLESRLRGAVVGPTFACIIGIQFSRLKRGDRYYFEHGQQTGSFTPDQLNEIRRKTTLSQVICANSNGISRIQKRVMEPSSKKNVNLNCEELPELNLKLFV